LNEVANENDVAEDVDKVLDEVHPNPQKVIGNQENNLDVKQQIV